MSKDLERNRQYMRELRAARVAARRCIWCDAGLQDNDGKKCVDCVERQRACRRAYSATEEGNARMRADRRRYYHRNAERLKRETRDRRTEFIALGVCPLCGGTPSTTTLCESCKARQRIYDARYVAKKKARIA